MFKTHGRNYREVREDHLQPTNRKVLKNSKYVSNYLFCTLKRSGRLWLLDQYISTMRKICMEYVLILSRYSSNKIRKAQNEHMNIILVPGKNCVMQQLR